MSGIGFITARIDDVLNWARRYSLWPMPFGTACCAIEFMGAVSGRYDISRFGAELVRFSPRQADLLLVMGTVSYKQAPILKRIYDQMACPKWVVAYGACAASGGFYDNYHTLQGIDEIIPVDVYIPGCPPRPEQLFDAILKIQKGILSRKSDVRRGHPSPSPLPSRGEGDGHSLPSPLPARRSFSGGRGEGQGEGEGEER